MKFRIVAPASVPVGAVAFLERMRPGSWVCDWLLVGMPNRSIHTAVTVPDELGSLMYG